MINFDLYNHLGFHNPYFIHRNNGLVVHETISEFDNELSEKKLDITSVVQILNRGYAFGDRTLIKGVFRTPWMAKPNPTLNGWVFYNLPQHDEKIIDQNKVVESFFKLLKEELLAYIGKKKNIGILLTGGMDSRVVACVLNNLINTNELKNINVYAYTWGNRNSRDIVYAERIAKMFNWQWEHLVVDIQQINENIDLTIASGCEFTPLHLHAMAKIKDKKYLDCVIAGSFGDSIGRGEYSGIKVSELKELKGKINNVSGLFRSDYKSIISRDLDDDIDSYHKLFPRKEKYQTNELDMQLHYMRRMLNPCLSVINETIPLFQMFTSPEVYSFIWSLSPKIRNNNIYKDLLAVYGPDLLNIPWARTGLKYPESVGTPDNYSKSHHKYGELIRENFMPFINESITQYELFEYNIFNKKTVNSFIRLCQSKPIKNSFYYEEKLLWIACLARFLRINNITKELPKKGDSLFEASKGIIEYNLKYYHKK